ncbi:hypothetical protein FLAG1_00810 [Fusarium langsethiae]|uniref:Uncharacterized protein n=1 Tax=Fusarium langsethiae TaxID=179993 RepID=A0A0M9F550_FUSLA|nr:hypothetical protein FLAG1_00810 [Fusarium langsethiae]
MWEGSKELKSSKQAINTRGWAIDTSFRCSTKEGNLSERPRERRTDIISTATATDTSRARDLLVMLIQLSVVKLARRYRPLTTLHQRPEREEKGARRATHERTSHTKV